MCVRLALTGQFWGRNGTTCRGVRGATAAPWYFAATSPVGEVAAPYPPALPACFYSPPSINFYRLHFISTVVFFPTGRRSVLPPFRLRCMGEKRNHASIPSPNPFLPAWFIDTWPAGKKLVERYRVVFSNCILTRPTHPCR